MMRLSTCRTLLLLLIPAFIISCQSTRSINRSSRSGPLTVKPVVAVASFDNLSNFSGHWKLGHGMADMMITELLDTDDVVLLERRYIDDVISEIIRQGQDLFRKEGRVERGRLKNVQYVIRGAVTDFSITGDASGWFGESSVRAWLGGTRSRVALNVYVTDVESGEIFGSVRSEGSASSWFFGGNVNYKDMAFGGDAFFKTPLGRATGQAMRKATAKILDSIPVQMWEARVAESGHDLIVINGGLNVGIQVGDRFVVRREGRDITDPVTGDLIETVPGPVVGRIEVQHVKTTSAHAVLVKGTANRGNALEPVYERPNRRTNP